MSLKDVVAAWFRGPSPDQSPRNTQRPRVMMYTQAGIAELPEPCGPFISVKDAQDMAAWCLVQDRAMRAGK